LSVSDWFLKGIEQRVDLLSNFVRQFLCIIDLESPNSSDRAISN
jgi:hypothetical protein